MDRDIAVNCKQQSKFFRAPAPVSPKMEQRNTIVVPSREGENKENVFYVISDDDEVEISSNVSIEARGDVDEEMEMDLQDPALVATVAQEDGYMSPTSDCFEEMQDLSSPLRPGTDYKVQSTRQSARWSRSPGFETEVLSSPPPMLKRPRSDPSLQPVLRTRSLDLPRPRAPLDDDRNKSQPVAPVTVIFSGPDLQHAFGDCSSTDIDCFNDEEDQGRTNSISSTPPTPIPLTPLAQDLHQEYDFDDSGRKSRYELHKKAVVSGWQQRWSLVGRRGAQRASLPNLSRRETNVTPNGRYTISHPQSKLLRPAPYPQAVHNSVSKTIITKPRRAESRKSLPFLTTVKGSHYGSRDG